MGKSSKRLDERVALDLVGRSYAAAVDAAEWPSFLTAFAKAVDGEGTAIWLHDNSDARAKLALPESSITAVAQWAPGLLETYAEHYTFTNVWTKNADRYAQGSAVTSSRNVPRQGSAKTEYYADWLRPQGLRYALGGPVERRGTIDIRFTCLRPERLGQFQSADLQLHQIVIPHIKRVLELHVAVTKQRAADWGVIRALSGLAASVRILDLEGRIAFATEAAHALDRLRDGLRIGPDGTPTADHPADHDRLRRTIKAALDAGAAKELACRPA